MEQSYPYTYHIDPTPSSVDDQGELQHQLDLLDDEELNQDPIPSVSLSIDDDGRLVSARHVKISSVKGEPQNEMAPVLAFKRTKKKKKKFELPWGFLIFGWILAVVSILVAAWMVIEVAGTFGKQKATEWLTSMMISLVQDIFFTQPLKVSP